jgi:hypothetical protein
MIKKLFQIELTKTANYNSSRIILGLHLFLFLASVIIFSQIDFSMPGFSIRRLYKFPGIWTSTTYAAKWLNLLLTVYIIILIGNEFSFKTFRQHVIDGLSRTDIFKGKLLVVLSLSLYVAVLTFLLSLVMGFIYSNDITLQAIFTSVDKIAYLFFQTLGFMALAMLITTIFRNTALSIVMYLLYRIAIEPLVRLLFDASARQYFPSKVLSNLAPDFIEMATTTGASIEDIDAKDVEMFTNKLPEGQLLLFGIVYTVIFLYLALMLLKKRNL